MEYNPKYLTPDQLVMALARHGFNLKGKGRIDTTNKVQLTVIHEDKGVSVSVSIVPNYAPAGWENAHIHQGQDEHYFVVSGKIILAVLCGDDIEWHTLEAGSSFRVPKGYPHNAFVYPETITVVSKIGEPVPCPENEKDDDWWPDPQFHKKTAYISGAKAERLAKLAY